MKMLARVFCCLILLTSRAALAQTPNEPAADGDAASLLASQDAETKLLPSDWERTFGGYSPTGPDFKQLRGYRDRKRTELRLLESRIGRAQASLSAAQEELSEQENVKRSLQTLIKAGQSDTSVFISAVLSIEHDEILGATTPGVATIGGLQRLLAYLDTGISESKKKVSEAENALGRISANIVTFRDDLARSEDAIDSALRSENREMLFKAAITAFFSLLIGVMIYRFFQTIHDGAGPKVGGLLLSDGGLQFVTIFVLIIAIILFGILNILEGRELAAILSGIAGYILGRGAQIKSDSSTMEDQPLTARLPVDKPAADDAASERSPIIQTADAIIAGRSPVNAQSSTSAADGDPRNEPSPSTEGVGIGNQQTTAEKDVLKP